MHDLSPDQILIGRYTLLRPLRSGADFPAWLATDRESGQQAGIWILSPAELTPDLDSRVREDLDNALTITDDGLAAVVVPSIDPAAFSRVKASEPDFALEYFYPPRHGWTFQVSAAGFATAMIATVPEAAGLPDWTLY